MGLPKRRHSKTRRDKRRTHDRLNSRSLSLCPQCGQPKLPHRICPECGYYRNKLLVSPKKKGEKK